MWRLRVLDAAAKELKALDRPVADRIVQRLRWLAGSVEQTDPEPLKRELKGMYKLRVGDHRVIYELLREERTILIHVIGHRSRIYRRR